MNELYLIPTTSVAPRDPVTGQPLPADGAFKPRTAYWLRRLRDGSAKEAKPPKGEKADKPKLNLVNSKKGDDK